MADYDLGTAKGKIVIDGSGARSGVDTANAAIDSLDAKANKTATGGLLALSGALAAVGAAGAAAFGLAVNTAADFEATLSGIKAVSGATEKQMDALKKKALQLGKDTAFSASEAASAMEELSKAGISVEEVLGGAADATVALAAAGGVSLPEAATIAANAMNQFGLSAEQMPHIADLIAGSANASAIDVNDFGMALAQAGATANLTGLSFDDLSLAITAMGNAGIKGSDAGTSLKTFLSNLQPVTERQINLFYELGLASDANATSANTLGNAFFDANGKVKSMSEIAGVLETSLAGMSEAQKSATLEAIFGSDAIRAAAIIAGEGAAGFDDLAASMGGISAADVAATRMDNFKGSVEQLKGSVDTLLISVGDRFLPKLREIVDMGTEYVNKFSEMDESTQDFAIATAAGVTGFAALAGGAGLFIKAAAPVAQGIGSLIGGVASMGSTVMSVFSSAGPWGMAILAIAAIVAGLIYAYTHFESVRRVIDTIGAAIRDFAMLVYEWFVVNVMPVLQSFADFFMNTIVPAISSFVETAWTLIQQVASFFTDTLWPAVQSAWDGIKGVIDSFWGWFDTNVISTAQAFIELLIAIFERVKQFVEVVLLPAFRVAWTAISGVVQVAFGIIEGIIKFAMSVIQGVIDVALGFIQEAWRLFGDNILAAVELVWNTIKGVVEFVLGIIRGIIQIITGLISGDWSKVWEGIKTVFNTVWEGIKGIVEGAINFVSLTIETVIDALKLTWDTFWNTLSTAFSILWNGIKLVAITSINAVSDTITTVINTLKAVWDAIWGGISAAVQGAWDYISPIIDKIVEGVEKVIDLVGKLKDAAFGGVDLPDDIQAQVDAQNNAKGNIIARKTLTWVAEAGPEAIIPLNDMDRAMYLMRASGLGAMFLDRYAPSAPSQVFAGSTTITREVVSGAQTITGVSVENLNLSDTADINSLMAQAEMMVVGLVP